MKKILLAAALVGGMLTACTQKRNNNQNSVWKNQMQWRAVCWTPCPHRPPTLCTTTLTTTRHHAVITNAQATPMTDGVSSVRKPTPTLHYITICTAIFAMAS